MSQADDLLKLKELLDSGVLTQDEFNKKKAEIMGVKSSNKTNSNDYSTSTNESNYNAQKKSGNIAWVVVLVFSLLGVIGSISSNFNTNNSTTLNSKPVSIDSSTLDTTQNGSAFVKGTNGKDFFQNVLCANTKCSYREPMELKANNIIPYDTLTYNGGNDKYSFEVTTNKANEIGNIQLFFYNYGKEDSTNYFMASTRLDYATKDVAKLTDFITNNIGKDEKIEIGDFTFHFYKGISNNVVILDIYTKEYAKYNGNI
ncbi:MAG: SHOCT domain-containing protein [Clostridia bacterium]|nr:SHOCT domain-containing protein [Clostridia bacterium]